MKTSDSIATIAGALVKAQRLIQHVIKDKTGKIQTKTGQGYEYKYSDLASVIDAVKGPLNDNGIVFVQCPGGDSTGVMVTTTFMHESGEWISDTMYLPVAAATPQAYGSAITYGKRYGLQSMTGLPSEDDDGKKGGEKDTEKVKPLPSPHPASQPATDAFNDLPEDQKAFLREQAAQLGELAKDARNDLFAFVERQHFDVEERLAIWSLLDSKIRSTIKRQRLEHEAAKAKAAVAQPHLAEQG